MTDGTSADDSSSADGETTGPWEMVGRFASRENFSAAVAALMSAGFSQSDLSVLDTHESLSASDGRLEAWKQGLAGLVGEIKYVGPLTTAGFIAIATGPVGTVIAGLMAAGITGAALSELLNDIRATPHTEAFAKALEGGAVLLWVAVADPDQEAMARDILARHGAADVHSHRRKGL